MGIALISTGCANNRFGVHSADYANVKELPPLKMPAGALVASNRYDIPSIPASNTSPIITDVSPPDYFVK